jgi:hypothetical protein
MSWLLRREREARPPRRRPVRSLVLGSFVAMLSAGLLAAPAQADQSTAGAVTDGLVLWYKLDEASGAVAADSSGAGRNGTVNGTPGWSGTGGLTFDGSSTYIKVPNNIMSGLSSISVSFDVNINSGQSTPYFLFGFGNTTTWYGDGYLFTTGTNFRAGIASGNWTTEQNTRASTSDVLDRGIWKHVTYTQTGSTGTLYEDGVAIATNSSITITPGSIGGGTTTANYVGKSNYTGDNLFKGSIKDFRVYNRALSTAEVTTLAEPVVAAGLAADAQAITLGDVSALTTNLTLPSTGANGSAITWATSNPAVITADGVVTRPGSGEPNATATLTATLTRAGVSTTRSFPVTVKSSFTDEEAAAAAAAAIVVRNLGDVRGNLALPASGDYDTTITWSSSDSKIIDGAGVVHRPAVGAGAAKVTLTAKVTADGATATRDFTATVPELPAAQAKTGYLFSYFTGEGTANGEQLYNAVSKANDPLTYREVNNAKPVLTSTLGTTGLRDPFIIRSPEGDKFYQIATDLKIYGNGNWDASQRTGSKSIMVWESTDLVNWTNQRLVKVSPDTAGNTWAPEAFYDKSIGAYVVFWASKLYDAADTGHAGSTYNRMMYATTRDFYTFSEPKVWKDPGYSVIDSTMIEHDGTYYRFTKDERSNTSSTPCAKFLIEEKSASILSTNYDFVRECIGSGSVSAGEGPLVFKSNTEDRWYLFIDEFGGQGYVPFTTTDLASGNWTKATSYSLPKSPRHGTVLPVTQAEYDRLLTAYQPNLLVTAVDPVSVTTHAGTAPTLPWRVTAHYADGSSAKATVAWDAVPGSAYAKPGTFTVSGTLDESQNIKATATVTIPDEGAPQVSATVTPATPGSGWFTGPVQLTVTAVDTIDGPVVPKVRITRSGEPAGEWVAQADPLTFTADGTYLVEYTATDAQGHSSGISASTVKIDTTPAISQAAVDTTARTVTLRAADSGSGVARVEYSLDNGASWQPYSTVLSLGRDETRVLYRAVDVAGNLEPANRTMLPAAGAVLATSRTSASLVAATVPYGASAVLTATVSGALAQKPSGSVRVLADSTTVGFGQLAGGKVTIRLANTIGVGAKTLRIVYSGDDRYATSSATVVLKVVRAASTSKVSAAASTVHTGKKVRVTTKVTSATGVTPSGTVRLTAVNGRTTIVRTVRLGAGGKVVFDLGPLAGTGTYKITAKYLGSAVVAGSVSPVIKVKVVR